MNKVSVLSLPVVLSLFVFAMSCGDEQPARNASNPVAHGHGAGAKNDGFAGAKPVKNEPRATSNGICFITGTAVDFVIDCTKEIENFSYEFMTSGNKLSLKNANINGKVLDFHVVRESPSRLKGSDKKDNVRKLTLLHTDGTTTVVDL